jgi:GNAT superfamily N-acetyltransferase
MKDPKPYLEEDFAYHADMLDAFLEDGTKVIYSEEDGVMLRIGKHGPYAISAKTEEAMEKMAKLISEKRYMAVVRPFKFLPKLFEIKGKPVEVMPCYQAAYKGKEPVPEYEVPGIEIKPLTEENLSFVCKNYDDDEDYIKSRIGYGMLGAFDENGNCAGFIGFHGEGSMGLLKVLPEYQRRGIGIALEAKNLNRRLSEGRIPFGHVVVGNEKSKGLQNKIGMEFSEKIVTWIFSDF